MTERPHRPYALVLTSYDPTDGGGAPLVTHGRIQSLYRLGYEVGLLRDSHEPVKARDLADLCRVVEHPPLGGQRLAHFLWNARRFLTTGSIARWRTTTWLALQREIDRRHPALVLLDGVRTAEYGVLLRQHGYAGRILLNEHNVEYDLIDRQRAHTKRLGKRLELWLRSWRLRNVESSLSQYADACLALSTVDRDHLARLNPGFRCELVPPAVDLDRFHPADDGSTSPEVLFIGSCHWPPNLDGLKWFADEVWPLIRARIADARLTVVGRGPP
ncbi:MAG: glycosyl transferase group 1, partial [Solirubrobacterales bacterium]|nr:glycosyl transferase group 1 [Solirubrobacterales bacterium]